MHLRTRRARAAGVAGAVLVASGLVVGAWGASTGRDSGDSGGRVPPSTQETPVADPSEDVPAAPEEPAAPDWLAGPAGPVRYVALGDSYTAAPGVPEPAGGVCARSTSNYPSVLARSLPGTEVVDVSCTGADTRNLRGPQRVFAISVPPQLDALDARTDLVTLGMGGNDFGVFATLVTTCPTLAPTDPRGAPCRAAMRTPGGGDRLLSKIERTGTRVLRGIRAIERRSPQARVVVVGYPQLAPRTGTCADLPLARGDYGYTRLVTRRLNTELREAARRSGAAYVDVARASRGHDVCAQDPWVNGKRLTNQAIPYHPFAPEQAAVARLVLRALD
ncbi:SGNH/GDSL hydrolase family protein [Nocardioides campestrisoli]|uniref:SGNH/GDSL hydrolase family protein n=1 Tax=Nocardioides campestrisoli TaxID=2736757 RepID=UPI00163DBCB2|nr:SGNH/GDSL hydrolase family protein [Nocardioides campestrisoli]